MEDVLHKVRGNSIRPQSPKVEYAVQHSLREIFGELLASKGLYQNLRIDPEIFQPFADKDTSAKKLVAEFTTRPVRPLSKGEGDDELLALRNSRPSLVSDHGVGENRDLLPLSFYLPNINTVCPSCQRSTPFLSRSDSRSSYFGSSVPPAIKEGQPLHQLFHLFYTCSDCTTYVLAFQVVRDGLRYQLTGRSIPYRPPLDNEWPKQIRPVVQDALVACTEGDIPASYYHLRTALEHYIKATLKIDIAEKIDGCDLCEQYTKRLDDGLKSRFVSVAEVYSTLSEGLHSRCVSAETFQDLFGKLLDHFKTKILFDKYRPKK